MPGESWTWPQRTFIINYTCLIDNPQLVATSRIQNILVPMAGALQEAWDVVQWQAMDLPIAPHNPWSSSRKNS